MKYVLFLFFLMSCFQKTDKTEDQSRIIDSLKNKIADKNAIIRGKTNENERFKKEIQRLQVLLDEQYEEIDYAESEFNVDLNSADVIDSNRVVLKPNYTYKNITFSENGKIYFDNDVLIENLVVDMTSHEFVTINTLNDNSYCIIIDLDNSTKIHQYILYNAQTKQKIIVDYPAKKVFWDSNTLVIYWYYENAGLTIYDLPNFTNKRLYEFTTDSLLYYLDSEIEWIDSNTISFKAISNANAYNEELDMEFQKSYKNKVVDFKLNLSTNEAIKTIVSDAKM